MAARAALDAFAALTTREDLTFHLVQRASIEAGASQSVVVDYALDVSAGNFSGVISGEGTELGLAYVNGTTWVRGQDGVWAESDGVAQADLDDILDPWRYLGPIEDLTFISRDPANMENFRFRNGAPVMYQTSSMRSMGITGEVDELNFILTPDGVPVSFWLHATTMPTSGPFADQELEMLTTVEFSKVGEPMTIETPG